MTKVLWQSYFSAKQHQFIVTRFIVSFCLLLDIVPEPTVQIQGTFSGEVSDIFL